MNRVNPPHVPLPWYMLAVVGLMAVAVTAVAFVASYFALTDWARTFIPDDWAWSLAVFLDGFLIFAAAVAGGYQHVRMIYIPAITAVYAYTAFSIAANSLHAFDRYTGPWAGAVMVVILAALPPVSISLSVHFIVAIVAFHRQNPGNVTPRQPSTRTVRVRTVDTPTRVQRPRQVDGGADGGVDGKRPALLDTAPERVDTEPVQAGVQAGAVTSAQFDKEARHLMIRELDAEGVNRTEIARRLNVSRTTVYAALNSTPVSG